MQGRFKREGSAADDAETIGQEDRGSFAGAALGGGPAGPETGVDEPSQSQGAPDDVPADPSPPPPTGYEGSRVALRNWRISTRLVSLIALPVVAATFFGALRIQESMEDVEQLDNMQLLTDMTQQATLLAAALQEERDRSAGPLVSGQNGNSDEVAGPRERTDAALVAFDEASLSIDRDDPMMRGVHATVLDIGRQLGELSEIREEAYQDPEYVSQTVSRYNELIDSLLSLSLDMAQATSNSDMIRGTRALASFSSAKESASIQRAIISAGLARGALDGEEAALSESDWSYGRSSQNSERASLQSFSQTYEDQERATELLESLDSGAVAIVEANAYIGRVFADLDGIQSDPRSYQEWYDEARTKIDSMNRIEQNLLDEMEAEAHSLRDESQREAILNGAITVLVLGVSIVGAFVVARSMVRSLRRLQRTAQEVARTRLPEVVKQMSEAEPQDVDTSVQSVGLYTRDEIGRVAQAFDDVHREAVRLAGEQALLRGNVNAMFTNLSRRSQGLIQRQLSLISELESREADPDQLSSLFKLDHLATRMRRNGENLLVLAGEEPGRRWTRPVPLVDVLRAAASEVEQYERIELSAVPKTDVAGRVVNDLVHLLAELLENATSFSSPQTKVKVTGHALPDGRILVEIHDTGIGLSPEDLAEINDRLANPPTVDVSVSRRMGLFVVGRLSLRHGIRIQLRPSDSGGTTALVMLPADVVQGAGNARPAQGQGQGRPGSPAGPGSATLHRERPPGGRRPAAPPAAGGGDTVQLPGPGARARGGVPGPAEPGRTQVPGGEDRPALPPRTAPAAPRPAPNAGPAGPRVGAAPGAPVPPPHGQQPRVPEPRLGGEAPAGGAVPGGPGGRPSWAADSGDEAGGRIPAMPAGPPPPRAQAERPRGHDEAGPYAGYPPHQDEAGAHAGYPRRHDAAMPAARPQRRPDELTDPLPPQPPERTPIFEEMESTWFGTRRAVPPSRPAAAAPPAAPAAPPAPAAPAAPAFPAAHAPAPAQPESRPAHAAGRREPVRTEPAASAAGGRWRASPNDERWRQAEQLRQPTAGGVTTSGLPRRVPRANLVPGAAQAQQPSTVQGPMVSRAPQDVRGRLTNLRRGIQQGRQAGSAAGRTDRDFGPTYQ